MMKLLLISCAFVFCLSVVRGNYWRHYNGTLPVDAYQGARNLYITLITSNGALPSTLYPEKNEAVTIQSGRRIIYNKELMILCTPNPEDFYWEEVNVHHLTGEQLKRLVVGGHEDGSILYIGRLFHEGAWKISKVFPPTSPWKGMNLWYNNGKTYVVHDFQILKYKMYGEYTTPHMVRSEN